MTHSGDLLDSLQLEDEATEATPSAPTETPEAAAPSSPESTEPPPASEPPAEDEGATPPPVGDAAPAAPAWKPTGKPFTFKVDATEVAPDGALLTEHGILMPQAAWDQVRSQYLGNRDVWRRTQEHWQGQLRGKDDELQRARQEAQVAQGFVKSLIDEAQASPEQFVARLDQIIGTLPVRIAETKARLYEEREAQREQERQQYEAAQAVEALESQLQTHIAGQVETLLANDFKGLTTDTNESVELLRELYNQHGLEIYESVDPAQAHLAASQGWQMLTQANGKLIGWYPERLRSQLDRRAQKMRQLQDRWTKTQKVETRNQATVTAPPVTPPPARPTSRNRNPATGEFAKLSPRERAKAEAKRAKQMLEDLTLDD